MNYAVECRPFFGVGKDGRIWVRPLDYDYTELGSFPVKGALHIKMWRERKYTVRGWGNGWWHRVISIDRRSTAMHGSDRGEPLSQVQETK